MNLSFDSEEIRKIMIQAQTLTENVAQKLIREENTKSKISFTEYLRIEPNNLKDDQFVEVKKSFKLKKIYQTKVIGLDSYFNATGAGDKDFG